MRPEMLNSANKSLNNNGGRVLGMQLHIEQCEVRIRSHRKTVSGILRCVRIGKVTENWMTSAGVGCENSILAQQLSGKVRIAVWS